MVMSRDGRYRGGVKQETILRFNTCKRQTVRYFYGDKKMICLNLTKALSQHKTENRTSIAVKLQRGET